MRTLRLCVSVYKIYKKMRDLNYYAPTEVVFGKEKWQSDIS